MAEQHGYTEQLAVQCERQVMVRCDPVTVGATLDVEQGDDELAVEVRLGQTAAQRRVDI